MTDSPFVAKVVGEFVRHNISRSFLSDRGVISTRLSRFVWWELVYSVEMQMGTHRREA